MGRRTTGTLIERNGHWSLRWTHNGKTVTRALGTTDREEAERRRDRMMLPFALANEEDVERALLASCRETGERREVAEQDTKEPDDRELPFAEAADIFALSPSRPQCGPGQLANYVADWRRFVWFLDHSHPDVHDVSSITTVHGEAFFSSHEVASLAAGTYNQVLGRLRSFWYTVRPDTPPGTGPFDRIVPRTKPRGNGRASRRELSEAELREVCSVARGDLRKLLAIGLYTALRLGDAATLRWEEVRLSSEANSTGFIARVANKTGKLVQVPIHPELRAILCETPPEQRKGDVLPDIAKQYRERRQLVSGQIQALFVACGIDVQARNPGQKNATCVVGFHSLRHSFVTICAKAGVPLAVVQELCGHGSPAIQRAYLHLGDAAPQAIAALPSLSASAIVPRYVAGACCPAWSETDGTGWLEDTENTFGKVTHCPWCGTKRTT